MKHGYKVLGVHFKIVEAGLDAKLKWG